jgi:quinoprotein dehydrogenase-associated probable ABC transporter substrate-binding protein
LRVCADPNNLPFSNAKSEGFENKLAELVARELHKTVRYVWTPERENFINKTLAKGECDMVMGVPEGLEGLDATRPYYASTYAFVYRSDRKLNLSTLKDPRLKHLKIGVHLLGDAETPAMQALSREGIVQNIVGFMIFGDYAKPNPPARLIEAVESGGVDVAAVWGPLGGYFAKHSRVPLEVVPIADTNAFAPLIFSYRMTMGVRRGDRPLKAALDGVIARRQTEIRNLLENYGVPLVALEKTEAKPR